MKEVIQKSEKGCKITEQLGLLMNATSKWSIGLY